MVDGIENPSVHWYSFLDWGAVTVSFHGVGIRLCRILALRASLLQVKASQSIIIVTHSDHVFLGLPYFLVQYQLSHRLQRTTVIPSMPSCCSSKAECVLSQSLVLQIQQIMVCGHCEGAAGVQGYLVASFADKECNWVTTSLIHSATYLEGEVSGG